MPLRALPATLTHWLSRGDPRSVTVALGATLFILSLLLNAPLFMQGEMLYRDSIEGGYASMVRFVAAHPQPWGWNPTQYTGLPTQFTYLPLPLYAGAALSWCTGVEPDYAHRLVAATAACLGPVTMFLFILYFTGRRAWAFCAAAAYILVCPLYGLSNIISNDRGYAHLPWRLQVLAKYGEGPHNLGLTLIPLALIAVWAAATGRKFRQVFLAALLLAAVALTNWVAALALAMACVLMLLAGLRTAEFQAGRVIAAGMLGYLLACFWLTPSFISTVAFNWPADAFNYHLQQQQQWMVAGLVGGVILIRALSWRMKDPYLPFVLMGAFAFGWIALGFYWRRVDTIPESRRYALEFSFFLFAAGFELLRRLRGVPSPAVRIGANLAALVIFSLGAHQARLYVTQGWERWEPMNKERTVEYRLSKWIADHPPQGRVFASGGVRFRLNSWFTIPQVGGTFESGLRNRVPLHLIYQVRTGLGSEPENEAADALLELRTMGVEYVVVNSVRSREHYRDFRNHAKLDGLLERVYEEPADWILRVPFRSYAHLVRPDELPPAEPRGNSASLLKRYVAAMDERPLQTIWKGTNALDIRGTVPQAMLVAVQANYDPGWEATQGGEPLQIERDKLGYMVVKAKPAAQTHIQLRFNSTLEQRAFALLSLTAWGIALLKLLRAVRPARPKFADVQPQGFARG